MTQFWLPNSTVIVPDPDVDVGELKPENSNVCGVAKDEILISELKALAFEFELTVKVAAVFALDVTNLELFWYIKELDFNSSSSAATSAKADIVVFWSSILLLIISCLGLVSASTRESTSCVIFKPEPLEFKALK